MQIESANQDLKNCNFFFVIAFFFWYNGPIKNLKIQIMINGFGWMFLFFLSSTKQTQQQRWRYDAEKEMNEGY